MIRQPGVYLIENTASGKVYVGSSTNVYARWRGHLHYLRRGNHPNKHLQAAWRLYGERSFAFRLLLVCSKCDVTFFEQRAFLVYRSVDPDCGYNKRIVAESNAGLRSSDIQRAATSAMMRDPERSKNVRAAASELALREIDIRIQRLNDARKNPEIEARRKAASSKAVHMRCDGVKPEAACKARSERSALRRAQGIAPNAKRKLSAEQVIEIRQSKEPKRVLAMRYGIDRKTLDGILIGRTYRWVGTQPAGMGQR